MGDALARARLKGSAWALRDALAAACGWPVELREFESALLATRATRHPRLGASRGRVRYGVGTTSGPNLRRIEVRVRRGFRVPIEGTEPAELGQGWYALDPGGRLSRVHPTQHGVRVHAGGAAQPLRAPSLAQLRDWEATPEREPEGSDALLDAPRGRFWLPPSLRGRVRVDRVCWRPGPIGAGLPGADLVPPAAAWRALVARDFAPTELGPGCYASLADALEAWPRDKEGDIRILDSASYGALSPDAPAGSRLTLHAHPGEMPCLASVRFSGHLTLAGVLVAGELHVGGNVNLSSCSVRGASNVGGGQVRRCLMGSIEISGPAELQVFDSVVGHAPSEGDAERPPASLCATPRDGATLLAERSTFLGSVSIGVVAHARDCLFCGNVWVARPQPGRLEHSPYPRGSRTGDAHDAYAFEPSDAPSFESREPDAPGYALLLGPASIARAAHDGGEPGAFHSLHVAARMARLQQMLARFMPAGFTASIEVVHEGNDG